MQHGSDSAPGAEPVDGLTLAVGFLELARGALRRVRELEPAPPPDALAFAAGATERAAALVSAALARTAAVLDASAGMLPQVARTRAVPALSRLADWRTATTGRGEDVLRAGRAEAVQVAARGLDVALAWIQADVVPRLVEGLLPYLTEELVPELLEELMPMLRAQILPVVIGDLASSQELRDLIYQQSQGFVRESSDEVRRRSRRADDAVEAGVRRLLRRPPRPDGGNGSGDAGHGDEGPEGSHA